MNLQQAFNEKGYRPFTGDGRQKVGPTKPSLLDTHPIRVTHSAARMMIEAYCRDGHSTHSGQGATLWVLLEWLHFHNLPYRLTVKPGEGHYIEHYDL